MKKIRIFFCGVVIAVLAGAGLTLASSCCTSCSSSGDCSVVTSSGENLSAAAVSAAVLETIRTRRSVRKYQPVPVSRDTMQIILDCGINAPNGMNRQSWEVRVVDNPEFIASVTELFVQANPKAAEDPSFVNMFRNAPTVVFIAHDPSYGMSVIDCGLMGENMILAAWSMGIGSCCLGGPVGFLKSPQAAEYLARLDFSEGYELLYCIGFGYPAETPAAKPRDTSKVRFID